MKKDFLILTLCMIIMITNPTVIHAQEPLNKTAKKIPVLTYHNFGNTIQTKEDKIYKVKPQDFENQIKAIKDNGYTFIDDNHMHDYYFKSKKLPDKPILITIDDGHISNYKYMFPIIKKYNAKVTIYLITSYNSNNKEYLTKEMIKEMSDSGLVSFQMHTHNLHHFVQDVKGNYQPALTTQLKDENYDIFWKRLYTDLNKNIQEIENMTGKRPISISYPFGETNEVVDSVLSFLGIKIGYIGFNQKNIIKPNNTLRLVRHNIEHNVSAKTLLNRIK